MLRSALDGTPNAYGSGRGGTPAGFQHAWRYSDSSWAMGDAGPACSTSEARWSEVKGTDRWRVDVSMRWHGAGPGMPEGRHVLVAEQRAEKLNPNQYATAMRGALVPIAGDAAGREVLRELIELYGSAGKPAASAKGGLMRR